MQRSGTMQWMIRDKATPREAWEYFQKEYLNHKVLGFAARCGFFGLVCTGIGVALYRLAVLSLEGLPISQQLVPRHREITFLERIHEGDSNMTIYRFALPNSYDYLGHNPITSVELLVDNHRFFPTRRWYTPISHPEQRGIIEIAAKDHQPGEMSVHLRNLEPGDKMMLGPWIREWNYTPNKHKEVGFICGNSGITPCLQLLVKALDDPDDKTKFSLLFCNRAPEAIPFKSKLEAIQSKYPDRFRVNFVCMSGGKNVKDVEAKRATEMLAEHGYPRETFSSGALKGHVLAYETSEGGRVKPVKLAKADDPNYDGYIGMVNRDLVLESMPPPTKENMILCCGPQAFMSHLCGRPIGFLRTTYFEGMYHGVLRDMGYSWWQVYKFGTSWHYYMSSVA